MPTALIAFATCLVYATVRYNVFKGVPWRDWPLYVINKAFALAALILVVVWMWRRWRARDAAGITDWIVAFLGIHVAISLIILDPVTYPKYYADGHLTIDASFSWLIGAVSTMGLWQAGRSCTNAGVNRIQVGCWGMLTGIHAGLLGYGGWFAPMTWPGYMVPITLISFLLGCAALILAMRKPRAS